VALSMAGRPRLLLLDEPMAGLSPAERESMERLIHALDPGIAVLLIEHDIDMAFGFAEQITVLHQGAVLAAGRKEAIAADSRVQESYLGIHAD
jgi:ABC-type branched-subunit amino acid transport system ATPase component